MTYALAGVLAILSSASSIALKKKKCGEKKVPAFLRQYMYFFVLVTLIRICFCGLRRRWQAYWRSKTFPREYLYFCTSNASVFVLLYWLRVCISADYEGVGRRLGDLVQFFIRLLR